MSEKLGERAVIESIIRLFKGLGAPEKQAEVMAAQLWKRSAQIALERDVKQVVALNELLNLAISGSQGMGPQDPASDQG